ncbi:MAG: hypothetical protein RLZZ546_257, partial [Bacteroidota bacterium]
MFLIKILLSTNKKPKVKYINAKDKRF